MIFPKSAAKEECEIDWQKIAEITDQDFGFSRSREKTGKTRFCARALLLNDCGEICVVESEKYGYMEIPGGGIEEGETILEALHREIAEETGFLIENAKPLGYIFEKHESPLNTHSWNYSLSYIFTGTPGKEVGTNYMENEIAEGFKPTWIKLEDFITKLKNEEGKIKNYGGHFSNRRSLEAAKYFNSSKTRL